MQQDGVGAANQVHADGRTVDVERERREPRSLVPVARDGRTILRRTQLEPTSVPERVGDPLADADASILKGDHGRLHTLWCRSDRKLL